MHYMPKHKGFSLHSVKRKNFVMNSHFISPMSYQVFTGAAAAAAVIHQTHSDIQMSLILYSIKLNRFIEPHRSLQLNPFNSCLNVRL